MLALSIQQPWVWLITSAPEELRKDVENRNWKTKIRGRILLHASKTVDWDAYSWVQTCFKISIPRELPTGGIVGGTTLWDCVTESKSRWFFGKYGLLLKDSVELLFMEYRGMPGFFNVSTTLMWARLRSL
jgi:hypothetical protein